MNQPRKRKVVPLFSWEGPMDERDAASFVLWLERQRPCGPHPLICSLGILRENGFINDSNSPFLEGEIPLDQEMGKFRFSVSKEFFFYIEKRPEFYLELLGRAIQNEAILPRFSDMRGT